MPVYVKIDEYKDIIDIIDLIRQKIDEAKEIMTKINDLKNQEDSELEQWRQSLDEIENRISFLNRSLFEPEGL